VATILTVIGAGIAGSALTYPLTWLRESRRTKDANRAPQCAAIAEIVEATYELRLRVFAFRDAYEERARQSEGKRFRKGVSGTALASIFGREGLRLQIQTCSG
jgi:hypothetical protein